MTDILHALIERFGLFAVFIGCLAEGESAATLAGFFAHQAVFAPATAFLVVFSGAFLGDAGVFLAGRRFARHPRVEKVAATPAFARALAFVTARPALAVLANRYIYGMRLTGCIAIGLSPIPARQFMALNALSALVWTALFFSLGYFAGAGAEHLVGDALARHERLLVAAALAILLPAGLIILSRRWRRRS